jgi:hypothetical protein
MYWGQAESGLNKLYGTSNGIYGESGDNNPPIPYAGRLYLHRSNALIALGSGSSLGNRGNVTVTSSPQSSSVNVNDLVNRLDSEVNLMINAGHLRPAFSISGNADGATSHAYGEALMDNFHNTAETLATLGRAYAHVLPATQLKLSAYLQSEYQNFSPLSHEHNGWITGTPREPFQLPPEITNAMNSSGPTSSGTMYTLYRDYGLWRYAQLNPSQAQSLLTAAGRPTSATAFSYPFQFNAAIAGTIGYKGLATLADNPTEANWAQTVLTSQLSARAAGFTKDLGNSNDIANDYTHAMSVAANFMFMTPELGDYLAHNAHSKVQAALDEYTRIAPYWFVSRFGATYAEGAIQPLYDYEALFQAKAYFQKASREELAKYLDIPATAVGDLFYIQNLVATLEAPLSPEPSPTGAGGNDYHTFLNFLPTFNLSTTIFNFNDLIKLLFK